MLRLDLRLLLPFAFLSMQIQTCEVHSYSTSTQPCTSVFALTPYTSVISSATSATCLQARYRGYIARLEALEGPLPEEWVDPLRCHHPPHRQRLFSSLFGDRTWQHRDMVPYILGATMRYGLLNGYFIVIACDSPITNAMRGTRGMSNDESIA